MNLLDKLKILLKLNSAAVKIKEAYQMEPVKPGWKTTEFWGKVAIQVFTVFGAVKGFIAPEKAALIMGIMESLYSLARSIVKIRGGNLPDIPAL